MAYTVQTSEAVATYLRGLSGLTREGRLKLVAGYLDLLRDHGDRLRSGSDRRLASGSGYFRFDYVFADGGRLHRAECLADDSAAGYGVLQVVYLDCQAGP